MQTGDRESCTRKWPILFSRLQQELAKGMGVPRIVELARMLVGRVLSSGDSAVDATVGNGHDTLWLAERVGPSGRVLGIDLQQEALQVTRNRLREAKLGDHVYLVKARHEALDQLLPEEGPMAHPRVVMLNLGYRPGGDPAIVTRPETTVMALEASVKRVAPGGLVSVVLYPGHPSGRSEAEQVLHWARSKVGDRLAILRCDLLHTRSQAPWLLALSPPVGHSE